MNKHLHIICLNVPYPVNYGGVFDLFHKLEALQQQGVNIILHCFEYGRGEQPALNKYCKEVYYYKRQTGFKGLSLSIPYMVNSRRNNQLTNRLLKDDYPILMEGVHCSYLLNDVRFRNRKCFVRLHNVEYIYYHHLYKNSSNRLKQLYYLWESYLLKKYEARISTKATFLTVIPKDIVAYEALGAVNIFYLPLFLPQWKVESSEGSGNFCLYHGDLSVAENAKAAKWLITDVFNNLDIPLVVAGKDPSAELVQQAATKQGLSLISNPAHEEMQELIAKAHIHILPSFNATGIKLKLLNALFNGRHCIVNKATVDGSGLEPACVVVNTAAEFKDAISKLYNTPFTKATIDQRRGLLEGMFDNEKNAKQLVGLIFA